jgi:hypothetical protein
MTQPTTPSVEVSAIPPEPFGASLNLQEQIDQLGAEILASAQRLATDPEARKAITEMLF